MHVAVSFLNLLDVISMNCFVVVMGHLSFLLQLNLGHSFLVIYIVKINTTHDKTTTKMHTCVVLECTEFIHFLKYIINKLIETKLLFSKILINYTTG